MAVATQTSVVLAKFKLTKLGVEADYEEYEMFEGTSLRTDVSKKFPFQPKDELLAAFDMLVPHLLMMCEFVNESTIENPNEILDYSIAENFKVTGLLVKESGVTIIGRRILKGKKVLNLTTPFYPWDTPDEADGYAFAHGFQMAVSMATEQALAYLEGDYIRQAAQLSLDFDNPTDQV
ncbi:hypothetical protein [Spirosoma fluviale]|uniref:Uncharacterized protein n=1 Tax=Spirosoma fluviale TaxID=1597977 RepID=A0A286FCX6_9BACT|nr:hypothetical protein [Spirosoma fluviale]SOD81085.1 hypothetical protein SAMN06269250_1669 [Spirosoma fluviale]